MRHVRFSKHLIVLVFGCGMLPASSFGADQNAPQKKEPAEQIRFFESKIRPLLADRCYKCHGAKKQNGGLRLDARNVIIKGGESGPAIVPGKPAESLLIEAINYESLEMPPNGKLKPQEIALLTRWVAGGAFWPKHDAELRSDASNGEKFSDEDRNWWAFKPVHRPIVPTSDGNGWARNEIDRFILQKLAETGLAAAPEADRRTLIRRLSFDLIGLPPSAEEIERFVNDQSADAYEKLVDRLLDSPRYGERWARHWLDLVRYSESDGYRKDDYKPTMWRYRDYVIRSFNDDKPYDQFVSEQIAGDELDPDNPDAVTATAFWRLYLYEYNQRDVRGHWRAIIDELTDISGEVFLGLGMGCAKCHDHKFDPILREDYFRFQAFFSSIVPRDDIPLGDRTQKAEFFKQKAAWESATKEIREKIAALHKPHETRKWSDAVEKFPPDVRVIAKRDPSTWDSHEIQIMNLVQRQIDFEYSRIKLNDEEQKKLEELNKQLADHDHLKPNPLPVSLTVTDAGSVASKTIIPGDRSGRDVLPGFLTLIDPQPADIQLVESAPNSSGRRAALAREITSPDNPLSTRVIVNRIWQYHFGMGLVETSSDFGQLGEKPSHPQLLDWLTAEFLDNDWTFKHMHRLIVLSSTYRQSAFHPDADAIGQTDPRNRLRWRWDLRRLDAEQIRDALLVASGELDDKAGGPATEAKNPRRSIYTKIIRNSPDPLLKSFDATDGFNSTAQRVVTTTPTQSLLMINGEWAAERAAALAKRVDRQVAADLSPGADHLKLAVRFAWQFSYGREPETEELTSGVEYLNSADSREGTTDAVVATFAETQDRAAVIREKDSRIQWKLPDAESLPDQDFTIEAVVMLRSLYPDANVRTIVSHWNGNSGNKGWNFGVTSTKSGYQPRNLILQLVGEQPGTAGTGKPTYEVIASNLRPELNRPYYVAVGVDVDDTSDAGVTFYLKDLSKPDSKLQMASVKHKVTGGFRPDLSLVLGDRDGTRRSRWDGMVERIRISAAKLNASELLINDGTGRDIIGFWEFGSDERPGNDSSGNDRHIQVSNAPPVMKSGIPAHALTDFCHVLLNSNEFLYVD